MKILVFNWRDITHPQAGGCELHLHEIGKRIVEYGHDLTLFCGAYEGCESRANVDGLEIIRKGGQYSVYAEAMFEYLSILRKRDFDVVVDDINGVPFYTPLYVRKPRVAVIHHLVKEIFFRELPLVLRPIGFTAEWLIPAIYKKTDFITVSDSSKKEMIEAGIPGRNIRIVHNGISGNFSPNNALVNPNPHILYLGRLKAYKQLDHLIRAVKIIRKRIPNIELSIAGSGDAEDDLKKLANELDVKENVKFHGFVNEEEKLRLLQSAWVFVTPSEKEGWGLTVIEANACGTPAIAYDVPGLRDSIQKNRTGILVTGDRVEDLAQNTINVLENDLLRKRLSTAALEWSKNYSWDKSAVKFLNILEEAIG